MKKKQSAAKSYADLMVSPLPLAVRHRSCQSPKSLDFNLNRFHISSKKNKKKIKKNTKGRKKKTVAATSAFNQLATSPLQKTIKKISDLKDLTSSRIDSIKGHLDVHHSEVLKDVEASQSRRSKSFKIHSQTCQQLMDEVDKEYKRINDWTGECLEVVKASYAEFITEAQATASCVCRTSVPELMQFLEKAIEVLRSRYGIPLTSI